MPEIKALVVTKNKKWYMSKTFYLNAIAIVLIAVQSSIGVEIIPLDLQGTIIAVLNLIVRCITNSNITL